MNSLSAFVLGLSLLGLGASTTPSGADVTYTISLDEFPEPTTRSELPEPTAVPSSSFDVVDPDDDPQDGVDFWSLLPLNFRRRNQARVQQLGLKSPEVVGMYGVRWNNFELNEHHHRLGFLFTLFGKPRSVMNGVLNQKRSMPSFYDTARMYDQVAEYQQFMADMDLIISVLEHHLNQPGPWRTGYVFEDPTS